MARKSKDDKAMLYLKKIMEEAVDESGEYVTHEDMLDPLPAGIDDHFLIVSEPEKTQFLILIQKIKL